MTLKTSPKNSYPYRIIKQYFQGDNPRVIFAVKQENSNEIINISALNLFYNDLLLEKFSPKDIRDIVYFAVCELHLIEKKLLQKAKNQMN